MGARLSTRFSLSANTHAGPTHTEPAGLHAMRLTAVPPRALQHPQSAPFSSVFSQRGAGAGSPWCPFPGKAT